MRSVFTKEDLEKLKQKQGLYEQTAQGTDGYGAQIAKFIPSEILTFYVGAFGALKAVEQDFQYASELSMIIFIVGIIGTLLITGFFANREKVPGIAVKTVISTIAFILWAFTSGEPFENLAWYNSVYGTIGLAIFLLFTPYIYKIAPK